MTSKEITRNINILMQNHEDIKNGIFEILKS